MRDKFSDLNATGWNPTKADIERTARNYLSGTFTDFLAR